MFFRQGVELLVSVCVVDRFELPHTQLEPLWGRRVRFELKLFQRRASAPPFSGGTLEGSSALLGC